MSDTPINPGIPDYVREIKRENAALLDKIALLEKAAERFGWNNLSDRDAELHVRYQRELNDQHEQESMNALIAEYEAWNKAQGLDLGSADEHLYDETLTQSQRDWLADFVKRWTEIIEFPRQNTSHASDIPEYYAVVRLSGRTEVTGFNDESQAEAYLADRLSRIGSTNEVYFEDVLPFRIFNSAAFAATFRERYTPEPGTATDLAGGVLIKMKALARIDPSLEIPLAALCAEDPGGVARIATQKYFTFDLAGDEAVFTNGMRKRIEEALGFELREVVYPGYEGETALAFPENMMDVARVYLAEVEAAADAPRMVI